MPTVTPMSRRLEGKPSTKGKRGKNMCQKYTLRPPKQNIPYGSDHIFSDGTRCQEDCTFRRSASRSL